MEKSYYCEECNKNYKTYQTLWKHKKKFHTENIIISPTFRQHSTNISPTFHQHSTNISPTFHQHSSKNPTVLNERPKKTERTICKYCNMPYSCYNSVIKHEKKCSTVEKNTITENNTTTDIVLSNENDITKEILNILDKQRVSKKTINEINKLLSRMNSTNNINNSNNNTTNNNSHNTINNTYNIIQLGKEDLNTILSKNEKLEILNKKHGSVAKLIELAHFNPKYPQLHSIILTNYKTNSLYLYDEASKMFKITNKDEAITDLIAYKVCDIEDFYNEYKNVLEDNVKKIIETIIEDRYENDDKPNVNKQIRTDVNNLLYNKKNIVKHLIK